ncbi:hypothetical protein DPMN_079999 [Dreissena polymorpha]|uniref:Uncharacterized protein n=1 Tax=Dreissena polymorpha TaxID=45954 RepID=A0A9D3YQK8_DREPO|nr:hypothetical protein DPMN_079999 [Dreissena polymorpha]
MKKEVNFLGKFKNVGLLKFKSPPWCKKVPCDIEIRRHVVPFCHIGRYKHRFQKALDLLTRKNAPPPGGHVVHLTGTIFELVQDNIGTILVTMFHEEQKINVASRVLTRQHEQPPGTNFHDDRTINVASRVKTPCPLGDHFHEDRTINVASRMLTSNIIKHAPPPGSHVFQATGLIFKLFQDIIWTNLQTKFHDDQTINVAS